MKIDRNTPCPLCKRFDNRGISVNALVFNKQKILLIKRGIDPFKGYWALPGGYLEWDESLEEAVKREVKEETGLEVSSLQLIGVYSLPGRHPKQVVNISYLVEAEGKLLPGDDAVRVKWFDTQDLPERLAFDHKKIINDGIKLLKRG